MSIVSLLQMFKVVTKRNGDRVGSDRQWEKQRRR